METLFYGPGIIQMDTSPRVREPRWHKTMELKKRQNDRECSLEEAAVEPQWPL